MRDFRHSRVPETGLKYNGQITGYSRYVCVHLVRPYSNVQGLVVRPRKALNICGYLLMY